MDSRQRAVGIGRRQFLAVSALSAMSLALAACAEDGGGPGDASGGTSAGVAPAGRWWMPAEEDPHAATWMCFPANADVWGADLSGVQATIADIALAIAEFEPVRMLVRPEARARAAGLVGSDVELIDGPVDDLWARDTLPLFVRGAGADLAAGRVRFNGWGDKQVHAGDAQLAGHVAQLLGIPLLDSGITGEGGGLENDGQGTLLAARSSWVNDNRNPGVPEADIAAALVQTFGAQRLVWVDGVAGQDITDGHIDTLARFAGPTTIVHEYPSYVEPGETWYDVATSTHDELLAIQTLDGRPYDLVQLTQPGSTRQSGDAFLSSYVNYYVCNGAVIAPAFGDTGADGRAVEALTSLYPGREVVALDIDPVAAGGGGIHCATQQQPDPD